MLNLIGMANHETRTPLQVGLSAVQLAIEISKNQKGESSINLEEILQSSINSNYSIQHTLRSLLETFGYKNGIPQVNPESFLLYNLVNVVANDPVNLSHSTFQTNFINEVESELWVNGDYDKIRIVLRNLISNAIKFTEKGNVTVTASQSEKGKIEISVTDEELD